MAPALAASSAWLAEKHSVTLTIVPSPVSALQVLSPSIVSGTLMQTLSAILRRISASLIIVAWSSATTSARTGPSTMPQISFVTSMKSRPDLAISAGVGGHPVEQARVGQFADVGDFGGVGEEFHGWALAGLGGDRKPARYIAAMFRTTALAALFPAVLAASPAAAAEEDTQFWLTGTVVAPVTRDVSASAMVSQRWRETTDVQVYRGALDWKFSPRVAIGGGLTYVEAGAAHEWRTNQQVALTFGHFSLRTQAEEAFRPGAARAQIRLRERVQEVFPVSERDSISGYVEAFAIVRTDGTGKARFDQLRTALSWQRRLNAHLSASAGYMLTIAPRSHAPDRLSHAPQLAMTYRL